MSRPVNGTGFGPHPARTRPIYAGTGFAIYYPGPTQARSESGTVLSKPGPVRARPDYSFFVVSKHKCICYLFTILFVYM